MKHLFLFSISCTIALLCNIAAAQIPDVFPISGFLTEMETGQPLSTPVRATFRLYTEETAQAPFWTEHRDANTAMLRMENGFFSAYLGTYESLPLERFAELDELWLGITIEDDTEMTRVQIGAVPFAAKAMVCQEVADAFCADGKALQGWENGEAVCTDISFTSLVNVPPSLTDGDNDTQYIAGTGVQIDETNNAISVMQDTIEQWCLNETTLTTVLANTFVEQGKTNEITTDMLPEALDAYSLQGFYPTDFSLSEHYHSDVYQPKHQRIVVVSPVGDGSDADANGDLLLGTMAAIDDASETNPYLLKIEPGYYLMKTDDNFARPLRMKEWVDIEGSGPNVTFLVSPGTEEETSGTVITANNAEIRNLSVSNTGASADYSIGIVNDGTVPDISNVHVFAADATNVRGIWSWNTTSIPTKDVIIKDCTVSAKGGRYTYSVRDEKSNVSIRNSTLRCENFSDKGGALRSYRGRSVLRDSVFFASSPDAAETYGLFINASDMEASNIKVTASGGELVSGIVNQNGNSTNGDSKDGETQLMTSSINAEFGNSATIGIENRRLDSEPGPFTLKVFQSKITVAAGATVHNEAPFTTRIAGTLLDGESVVSTGGTLVCSGVYNTDYAFLADTCP